MKSAVFFGKHDLRVVDSPLPQVADDEVLIQVMACGVCGTDVHIFQGDEGAAKTTPPTILGHEFAGVVKQIGAQVTGVAVGDRVCVDPNDMCGECYYCHSGLGHFCQNMVGIGTTVNGGFAQYVSVRAKQVYPLAEQTTFAQGAMSEPVSCCLHGIDLCRIQPASRVLVIGGGMIGLIMMQLAKLAGAYQVALLEPVEQKRAMAQALGADLCINPLRENVEERLRESGFFPISTVIECAGLPSTMAQAVELASNKATVMLFGLTKPQDTFPLKPFTVFQKELTVTASFINPYTMRRAVDLINAGKIDVSSMVCDSIPLEELANVLSDPALRAQGKYIVDPNQ